MINCERYQLCEHNSGRNNDRYRDLEARFREADFVDERTKRELIVDKFIDAHKSNEYEWADTPVMMMTGLLFGTSIVSFFKNDDGKPNSWVVGLGIDSPYDDRNVLNFRRFPPRNAPCIYVVNENSVHIEPVESIDIDGLDSNDDL